MIVILGFYYFENKFIIGFLRNGFHHFKHVKKSANHEPGV